MKPTKKNFLKIKTLIVCIILYAVLYNNSFSQVPAALEREIEQFNRAIYDALIILKTSNESDAVSKLSILKPQLIQKAESLSAKIIKVPEMNDDEENAYLQRFMDTQLYKDYLNLLSDQAFLEKVNGNPRLKKEFDELIAINDLGLDSQMEETAPFSGSQVCSFKVGPGINSKGEYIITASGEDAFACVDGNGAFSVEINGRSGSSDFTIMLFIEEPVPGKYKWENEMQVVIQEFDENGNEGIQLSNYYNDGYITFDRIDDVGGKVSGSFSGKFSDDTNQTDKPVIVQGKFNVIRQEDVN